MLNRIPTPQFLSAPQLRALAVRGKQRGQATVEFALILPILVTLIFGMIEFGDAFLKWQQLSAGTSEGARRAAVSRNDGSRDTTVRTAVRDGAPNLVSSNVAVNINSTWAAGSSVTVTATYPETVRVLGLPVWSGNLTSSRTTRVEQ